MSRNKPGYGEQDRRKC